MNRLTVVCVALLAPVLIAGQAHAERLFFTQDSLAGDPNGNDTILKVDRLLRGGGVQGLNVQPGYAAAGTGDAGLNVGVIDADIVSGTPVVAIGGNELRTYDADMVFQGVWDPDGPGTPAGIDALDIGDFGALTDKVVISRETGAGANDMLIMSTDALAIGSNVGVAGGPTGGGTAHGLVLGDFQGGAGNEVLIGMTDASVAGGNGHQLFYTTGGNSGQFFLNRLISDVGAAALGGAAAIDYILTGNNGVGVAGFGQGSHIFESNGAAGVFKDGPGLGGPHNPPSFNAVAIGNMDGDADLEIVLAGNDFVRVLDNNYPSFSTALFQSGGAGGGAQFVDVTISDADQDGVNEAVAVTDTGLVFMFGHSVVGDPNSAFSGGPIGIYGSGTEAFLGVTTLIPEPTSALLVLAALAGVMPVFSRRRTAA